MCFIKNEETISKVLGQFSCISLDEMDSVQLLDRTDIKFMFNLDLLPEILRRSKSDYRVLTISGRRYGRYETRYFDTSDFELYNMHHNGKLNRYKIRFRRYVDSDIDFFEIKFKTNTGRTQKSRIKFKSKEFCITGDLKELLECKTTYSADALREAVQVNYKRITLVNNNMTERLTIDFGMTDIYKQESYDLPDLVIAEVKQDGAQNSPFLQLMREMRIEDSALSKYCLGVANCVPDVKRNQFKPKLMQIDKLCYTI